MSDPADEGFEFLVEEVFPITGRGVVAAGRVVRGAVRSGEQLDVWQGDTLVVRSTASVEFINRRGADPSRVALLFRDASAELLRAGQVVRRADSPG